MQDADLIESVVLQPLNQLRLQRLHLSGHAERAVVHVPSGAAGDLADLRGREIAMRMAVELAKAGERDMIEIEVQAHPNRVGGHQKVHVAILIERHLRVARAGAERAEYHGRAAALPPHQFGDGIYVVGREGDDRRTAGQAGDLLVAGIGQLGEPRARHQIGAGEQLADGVAHGRRAEQQRFAQAPRVEHAVGEDMAALAVGRELDLIDGHEVRFELPWHCFHGAHIEACGWRLDLLLACDERHLLGPRPGNDLVVDLAGQEPQRQADHAHLVCEHALDGQMRLAGIGGPEHRGDAAALGQTCGLRG